MNNAQSDHPLDAASQGGRTSWEEPYLPLQQRLKKHWRQMLVHLWGPAGSLAFHFVAIGVLVTCATNTGTEYPPGPVAELVPQNKVEKLETKEVTKPDREVQTPDPDFTGKLPGNDQSGPSTVEPPENIPVPKDDGMGPNEEPLPDKTMQIATPTLQPLIMKKLYTNRTHKGIQDALERYNGDDGGDGTGDGTRPSSTATESAVLRALRWLKREQQPDGCWHGDKQNTPPAMTALALLAYLGHGETPASPEFGATVKKAIDWMVANQESDGQFKGRDANNYSQPMAAYALCEAYGLTQHPTLRDPAARAIARVVQGQHATGGFNYNLNQEPRDDTSYMAWCCQALKAAKMAGLDSDVPGLDAAIKKGIAGMKQNAHADGGFGYTGRARTGLSGAGALCLQLMGAARAPEVVKTIKFLETCTFSFATPDQQPYGGGSQVYYWYYITQAKFQDSTNTFKAWNRQFAPELCRQQIKEPGAIEGPGGKMVDVGHWVSPSKGEHTGGTVQDTALCTLMLEVYYRYLPSFQHVDPVDELASLKPRADDVTVTYKK